MNRYFQIVTTEPVTNNDNLPKQCEVGGRKCLTVRFGTYYCGDILKLAADNKDKMLIVSSCVLVQDDFSRSEFMDEIEDEDSNLVLDGCNIIEGKLL